MLNLSFAFREAISAVENFGDDLEVPSLVPTVYLMQRDVINHYRNGFDHYFELPLNESCLQNSSLGTPYQKWAFFVNKNHELLSFSIHELLRYTSRLVHETSVKIAQLEILEDNSSSQRFDDCRKFKELSNLFTRPILEVSHDKKAIGIRIHEDEKLIVTSIRDEPRSTNAIARSGAGNPPGHFLQSVDEKDLVPITPEEYRYYTEIVSDETYNIQNRRVLGKIKKQGVKEITELERLCGQFAAVADAYVGSHKVIEPHKNLNESYWI